MKSKYCLHCKGDYKEYVLTNYEIVGCWLCGRWIVADEKYYKCEHHSEKVRCYECNDTIEGMNKKRLDLNSSEVEMITSRSVTNY